MKNTEKEKSAWFLEISEMEPEWNLKIKVMEYLQNIGCTDY